MSSWSAKSATPKPRMSRCMPRSPGHLVLTTLHTETAAAAVPRLLDLGVEGYLLRSTLRAVIAQRLLRQLCEHCKAPFRAGDHEASSRFPL